MTDTARGPVPTGSLPFVRSRDDAPAYWFLDALWIVLADSSQTGGAFSVMEQRMRPGGGPAAHVHPVDEWFSVLDGVIDFRVAGEAVTGTPGDSIWIPRGTVHEFRVRETAHVYNGYTPGGFEQIIAGLGQPTDVRELPPEGGAPDPAVLGKLMDNLWSASADSPWAGSAGQR